MTTLAEVRLWGRTIGAVSLEDDSDTAAFQYTPEFAGSGIEVSPITMQLGNSIYQFPGLAKNSFHGLPGL
jgi:serine/threonine-protein kinase HipA